MKRVTLIVALLSLGAGPALAAIPAGTTAVDHGARSEGDRMTTALNLLEAEGYVSFSGFRPDGDLYTAMVTQNGRSFAVNVNPDSGQVTPQG